MRQKDETAPRKPLTPAAERALAEAAARRAEREHSQAQPPQEIAGRGFYSSYVCGICAAGRIQ